MWVHVPCNELTASARTGSSLGISELGFPKLFVFDDSAPTFQRVVADLSVEGQLISSCVLFSVRSVTPSSHWTASKTLSLSTGKGPYAFWVGYIPTAPRQHASRALIRLRPESAQVHVQEVMQTFVRYSECLTGLPKRRFKSTVSRSSTSPITFSESRPQSGSLSPDLRVYGRPDITTPSSHLCPTFSVSSHRARFDRLILLYLSTIPLARCGLPNCRFISSSLSHTRLTRLTVGVLSSAAHPTTRPRRKLVGKHSGRARLHGELRHAWTCGLSNGQVRRVSSASKRPADEALDIVINVVDLKR
jgi:hypothetical protein